MVFSAIDENRKQKKLFWLLNILFWVSNFILDVFTFKNIFDNYLSVITEIYNIGFAFTASLFLRYIYTKYRVYSLRPLLIIVILIASSIGCGMTLVFSSLSLFGLIAGNFLANIKIFFIYFWTNQFFCVYPFIAWNAVYLGFKIYEQLLIQKQNAEKAASLAQSAQLEMLRYQLNPHFIFNTLSSLRALIRKKENDIAEEMVTKIAEFLKYSLLEGEAGKVPLSREIKTINHYFDIEKVRFKDQLLIEYHIDPLSENFLIPVFLIHPLIENAVKHGMKTSPSPQRISLKTQMTDNKLSIEIINSGIWIEQDPDDSKRTGLQNTRKRLELAYPNNHAFEIIKTNYSVGIKITINTNDK
jgi:sensor histidine kinase YesM